MADRRTRLAAMANIKAQVKEAGEAVRLMKEANKAAPGTHSKVCVVYSACSGAGALHSHR